MNKFIKVITNRWLQLASLIINFLFTIYCAFSYSSLSETDVNQALKKPVFLIGMIVFGLFTLAQILSPFLSKKKSQQRLKKDK